MGFMRRRHDTAQMIHEATEQISGDIESLIAQKTAALDIFSQTVVRLNNINAGLDESLSQLDNLSAIVQQMKENAVNTRSDNAAIIKKIEGLMSA